MSVVTRAERRRADRAAAKPAASSGAVTVGYVHGAEVAYSWHQSLTHLMLYDLGGQARTIRGGTLSVRYGTGGIVAARNQVAAAFLDTKDAEWLWWVDTDMGFEPDTIERLVAVADPTERPVVGALAFMMRETATDNLGGFHTRPAPTIFDWVERPDGTQGFSVRWRYDHDQLIRCSGTGSACILIHRSVLAQMRDAFGTWYDPLRNPANDGELISEDLSFCGRLAMLDIPLHVHTGIRTSHLKQVWLSEQTYTWFAEVTAKPTAVIVPVLRRPHNAAPFMDSLAATAPEAAVYALASDDDPDTAQAWRDAGATVITTPAVTFAEKANVGYRATTEPWLFLTGDDVRFHPGWLQAAQRVATATGADVVATNDKLNAAVQTGQHATHPLIRRRYVDEHGASWDGPGTVAHEGYRHWYVDNEWTTVARQRHAFAYAPDAIVEHLHPLAGKADDDEVYRLGQRHQDADGALYRRRLAANA